MACPKPQSHVTKVPEPSHSMQLLGKVWSSMVEHVPCSWKVSGSVLSMSGSGPAWNLGEFLPAAVGNTGLEMTQGTDSEEGIFLCSFQAGLQAFPASLSWQSNAAASFFARIGLLCLGNFLRNFSRKRGVSRSLFAIQALGQSHL